MDNLIGVPTWTGKWADIFQSGKSRVISNRLEKSGKITQNTGNFRQMLFIIFSDISMNCALYNNLLKLINFPGKVREFCQSTKCY